MNKSIKAVINILKNTCTLFTVMTIILYTGGMLASDDQRLWIPTFSMIWMILIFSFCLNIAGLLLKCSRIPLPLRILLHYFITMVIFYSVFLLWRGYGSSGNTVIAALTVFTIVYAVAAAALLIIKKPWRKSEQSASEYQSILK